MGMRCRIKSRLCAVPLAACLLAAVCLLAALPRVAVLARGLIDTGRECSLTVKTETLVLVNGEENANWSELNEAQIQVYLYRVAGVNEYGEYESLEGFGGLGLEKIDGTVKADDWREMARAAADILGLPVPPRAEEAGGETAGWSAGGTADGSGSGNTGEASGGTTGGNGSGNTGEASGGTTGEGSSGNTAGAASGNVNGDTGGNAGVAAALPVAVGRLSLSEAMELPADLPDKLARADAEITVKNGTGTMEGLAQGMYLVWVMPVETDCCQYTFLPYLVSLPNNSYDAAVPGSVDEWEYETAVGLKPRQNLLYGSLRVRKTLDTYNEALGEAMFVFLVEARKDLDHDGEKEIVYSNVVGLEFDAHGTKEMVIENIPAGSEVTVEEIYSGSAYTVQGSTLKVVTVWAGDGNGAGDMPTVEFTNDYDNRVTYGTGAVNRFTHDGDGWSGSRMPGSKGGGGE